MTWPAPVWSGCRTSFTPCRRLPKTLPITLKSI